MHCMSVGTIDFYYLILLTVILTLPGGLKVSGRKTYRFHYFLTFFSTDKVEFFYGDKAMYNYTRFYLLVRYIEHRK